MPLTIMKITVQFIGHILKNKQKNKCVCVDDIMRLTKMKNRSHRYDINRPTITHKMFEANSSFHVK